jgi:DNA repair protein RadA/Sms
MCARCHHWGTLVDEDAPVRREADALGPRQLGDITIDKITHIRTGFDALDRALGGWVEGTIYLLSGDPGGGKSTFALQTFGDFDQIIYLTGEEREEMIKLRAKRLEIRTSRLWVWRQNEIRDGLHAVESLNVDGYTRLVVVDSVHSMYSSDTNGAPGSNYQVAEVIRQSVEFGKDTGSVVLLIGQINKDSEVAGPRLSEHLVDCTMHMHVPNEDEPGRILRIKKNRYGEAPRKIRLQMTGKGLAPVLEAVDAA